MWPLTDCLLVPNGSQPLYGARLILFGVDLDQAIKELASLEQRFDPDVFVESVDVANIGAKEYRLHAVGCG